MRQHELKIPRVYEVSPDTEGYRILVDRYAARDPRCNHAIVLRDWISERIGRTVQ